MSNKFFYSCPKVHENVHIEKFQPQTIKFYHTLQRVVCRDVYMQLYVREILYLQLQTT